MIGYMLLFKQSLLHLGLLDILLQTKELKDAH